MTIHDEHEHEDHGTEAVDDHGGVGAEGGASDDAGKLPAAPDDDDTALGDTDQHSQATPGEHDQPKH